MAFPAAHATLHLSDATKHEQPREIHRYAELPFVQHIPRNDN